MDGYDGCLWMKGGLLRLGLADDTGGKHVEMPPLKEPGASRCH